jgi:hypothetical protein
LTKSSINSETPDWGAVRRQFRELTVALTPYHVPSADEIDRYVLSQLTYGQIHSSFRQRLESGEWVYSVEEERRGLLQRISYELGFTRERPDGLPDFIRFVPIDWDFISRSIERELLTSTFLVEWGRFNYLVGRYEELIYNSDRAMQEVDQALAGRLSEVIVQKCWYAHWTRENARSADRRDVERARSGLADLCLRINEGDLLPAAPYPRVWFVSLLELENGEPGASFKSTYRRLTGKQLEALVSHPLITPSVLPPLSAAGFRAPTRRPRG